MSATLRSNNTKGDVLPMGLFNELLSANRTSIMGCAIVAIMLFHQPFFHGNVFVEGFHLFGHWGVDIFLLISGFGIVNSLRKNSLKQYFRNRASRLLPVCLFVGSCKALLMLVGFVNYASYGDDYFLIVTQLSMWYVYAIVIYYMLAPTVYRLLLSYGRWVMVGVCILSFALSFIPFKASSLYLVGITGLVVGRLPAFVFGMYLALYPSSRWSMRRIFIVGIIALTVCMTMRIVGMPGYLRIIYILLLGALPMLAVLATFIARGLQRIGCAGVVDYLGRCSLEIYLWHGFVFLNISTHPMFAELSIWPKTLVALALSLTFAFATHAIFATKRG